MKPDSRQYEKTAQTGDATLKGVQRHLQRLVLSSSGRTPGNLQNGEAPEGQGGAAKKGTLLLKQRNNKFHRGAKGVLLWLTVGSTGTCLPEVEGTAPTTAAPARPGHGAMLPSEAQSGTELIPAGLCGGKW